MTTKTNNQNKFSRINQLSLYLMAVFYVNAGISHFIIPQLYLDIMPPWLPWHLEIVYISGVCEIVFGALLFPRRTRRIAAWLIIALLVAVYPANIQMAINYWYENNPQLWIALIRLPIQVLLVWWAWVYTKYGIYCIK